MPGDAILFIGEGKPEIAIHKGVDVESFRGVDISLPDWRVVVEIEVPEGFAGEAGGNHIGEIGRDGDAIGNAAFKNCRQSFSRSHSFIIYQKSATEASYFFSHR